MGCDPSAPPIRSSVSAIKNTWTPRAEIRDVAVAAILGLGLTLLRRQWRGTRHFGCHVQNMRPAQWRWGWVASPSHVIMAEEAL
jgi:hypothetical protein